MSSVGGRLARSRGFVSILLVVAIALSFLPFAAAASPSLVVQATSANCVSRGSGDGLYTITGEVVNKGNSTATLVQVVGSFYDDSGRLLVNSTAQFTNPPSIAAGLSAPFSLVADCPGCALVASYKLSATQNR